MNDTVIGCGYECGSAAYAYAQWGPDSKQSANLCKEHLGEVWKSVQPQIKAGECFWTQEPPREGE